MAQRRSLAWTELRVGILVITSFALLALAIFYISGQSGFFVPNIHSPPISKMQTTSGMEPKSLSKA